MSPRMSCAAFLAVVVAASAAVFVSGKDDVVTFKIDKKLHPLFADSTSVLKQGSAPQLQNYVFKNCGDPKTDLAKVGSIVLGPDPVVFPGPLTVSFQVNITKTLDAPLKGQVVLEKKLGSSWIKIPCIGVIGSCEYSDVCDLLKNAQCPPPFVAKNIPCKCPFSQGNYALPSSKFVVEVPVFPAGDYHAHGNLTSNGQQVACVDLFVTFA
ncbi:ganglioside GM2 activator [Elysia marginata]|uniref:Ganglioside GM2 activator n=1 Tax=Elysia marginata TaxID=1093978 RepID=A0AAV4J901_9GAST|nr:ganglioside GM2 activator [Elysia marginata]